MDSNPSPNSAPPEQPPVNQDTTQPSDKTNTLSIVGLVLAFVAPFIGLIISIISLSQIKKSREQGRGLAIAGIVISSIGLVISVGVFIALVTTSFSGVQQKARDTERSVDIKSLASNLEVYNQEHGYYPSFKQLNDDSFRAQNMPQLDKEALRDPQSNSYLLSSTTGPHVYTYLVLPDNCNNVKLKCTSFTLSATAEEGEPISASSLATN